MRPPSVTHSVTVGRARRWIESGSSDLRVAIKKAVGRDAGGSVDEGWFRRASAAAARYAVLRGEFVRRRRRQRQILALNATSRADRTPAANPCTRSTFAAKPTSMSCR
jgi:hypothetical protein